MLPSLRARQIPHFLSFKFTMPCYVRPAYDSALGRNSCLRLQPYFIGFFRIIVSCKVNFSRSVSLAVVTVCIYLSYLLNVIFLSCVLLYFGTKGYKDKSMSHFEL